MFYVLFNQPSALSSFEVESCDPVEDVRRTRGGLAKIAYDALRCRLQAAENQVAVAARALSRK